MLNQPGVELDIVRLLDWGVGQEKSPNIVCAIIFEKGRKKDWPATHAMNGGAGVLCSNLCHKR